MSWTRIKSRRISACPKWKRPSPGMPTGTARSSVLGINVIEERQDPRFGDQSFTVSDITLGEPDTRLFQMPANLQGSRT